MNRTTILASAALALGLAGACAPNTLAIQSEISTAYDFRNFTNYHRNKDTLVEIQGGTFGANADAFRHAVLDAMRGQHPGGPTNFTTNPGPNTTKNLKVVMAFDSEVAHNALCSGRKLATGPSAGGVPLQAAWCFGDRVDSYVIARSGTVKGVDDPNFRAMVARVTLELFPTYQERNTIRDEGGRRKP